MEVAPTPGTQALLSPLRDVALSPRRASKPLLPPLLPPSTAGGSEARKADSPATPTPKPLPAPRRDEGQVDGALASPENEYVEEGRFVASAPPPRRRRATWAAAGTVAPELIQMHVLEVKQAVHAMMRNRPTLGDALGDANITVDIKRCDRLDEEEASISTSVIMAMTAGATTVMY